MAGAALAEGAAALQVARAMTTATAAGAAAAEEAASAPALVTSPPEEASRRGEQGQAGELVCLGQGRQFEIGTLAELRSSSFTSRRCRIDAPVPLFLHPGADIMLMHKPGLYSNHHRADCQTWLGV